MKAKFIIHTVGPKYPTENCQLNLAKCYIESLNLAKKNEIHSITFPSISTGKFSYPKKEACEIAVKAVYNWLKKNKGHDMKVVFSCVDPSIYGFVHKELTSKWMVFIDYVDYSLRKERRLPENMYDDIMEDDQIVGIYFTEEEADEAIEDYESSGRRMCW